MTDDINKLGSIIPAQMGSITMLSNPIKLDIIIQGFSMKTLILDVLMKHELEYLDDNCMDEIAEQIKKAFAEKCGIKYRMG